MQIQRLLKEQIMHRLKTSNKIVIIYGARQVGKTTLCKDVISDLNYKTLFIDGDQGRYLDLFKDLSLQKLQALVDTYELLFIDEAQRISEIGLALKILADNVPDLKILVTGSSSLDIASKVSEPLTGRIWTYRLYPISLSELTAFNNNYELEMLVPDRLIYGSYPEMFSFKGDVDKREYLHNLTDSYLYKDLLEFSGIKNSSKIRDLLKLLAFQVGSEVSLSELATELGMSKETVSKYIDYLEKTYVVFRLSGFSRNLRKEVTKMDKIYFYDLGVRNTLIDNVKGIKDRDDVGKLWENFLITERMKINSHNLLSPNTYFWRVYTGAELDYVEETGGKLFGYEFKSGSKVKSAPTGWLGTYKEAEYKCINQDNFLDFVL